MSTAHLARKALKDLGQSTFPPKLVRVTYGSRVSALPGVTGGWLAIGDVTGESEPEALGPTRPMLENYRIQCTLSYTINGTTDQQETAGDTITAWFTTFEEAIRAVPGQNLGVSGIQWAAIMGDWSFTDSPASETNGPINCQYVFNVHVRARYRLT